MSKFAILLLLGSIQASAGEAICKIRASGTVSYRTKFSGGQYVNYYFTIPAETLEACASAASSYLGSKIKTPVYGYDWKGPGSIKVTEVKYKFKKDGFKATGIIR